MATLLALMSAVAEVLNATRSASVSPATSPPADLARVPKILEAPKAVLYKGWMVYPHVEWSALHRRGLHLRAVTNMGWEQDVITVPISVISGPSRDDPQGSWLSPSTWLPLGFNLNGEDVLLGFGGIQVNMTRAQIAKWQQIEWQLVDDIGCVRARAIQQVTPY